VYIIIFPKHISFVGLNFYVCFWATTNQSVDLQLYSTVLRCSFNFFYYKKSQNIILTVLEQQMLVIASTWFYTEGKELLVN
jgi:hypothetical protein